MTRKTCFDHSHVDIVLKSVCHELQLLGNNSWSSSQSSLNSKEVYETLDLLLRQNEIKLNDIQMTRNKMPRTRANSMCYRLKRSPLSSTNVFSHRLRTRRHTAYVNHFLDTSGDDDSNHVRPMRELRSSSRIALSQIKSEQDGELWDSGRPKRMCISKKRASADERLVFDNRNYYKVEVMNSKLRSFRERKIKSPVISEESEDDKVYSFPKKTKRSEISRLNDEAENFLFPHKDESSSDETDRTDTPQPTRKKESSENIKPKVVKNETDEASMDSNSSESSVVKKKRRLTQAEAFILDNQRYYKFETPGSRLRYQGSYLSPVTTKNNGEYSIKQSRTKELPVKPKLELEDLQFAFETVPNTEPWYTTFQRQDKGQECYTCYNYCAGYKPFLLPYEMGPLPPLNPRICFYAYKQMKKELLGDTGPSTSEACSTPEMDMIKTDYNSSTGEDTKSSEDLSTELLPVKVFRKTRRRKVLSSKNPRKSPRQHASTLAILSSLIHQRKRREYKCRVSDPNLSVILEEKEEPEPDYEALTKSIDDMLSNSCGDMNLLDNSFGDDANIDVHCKPNAVECLEDYIRVENGGEQNMKNKCRNVTRKACRKKKKNRTGWPNKNKKPAFRKEGSDSRDGVESSIKNSRIDSGTEENSSDNNLNRRKNKNSLSNKLLNVNKINGDVQVNKFNGEIYFKNVGIPRRKEHRESSSENCVEVVIPSVGDKIDCVNVDLAKWENAEKLLAAKIRYEDINNDILFQPIVRVQKLDTNIEEKCIEKQFNNISMPPKQSRRLRRIPASPKSPNMLLRPRAGWY